jgi:hypothetical protein
MASEEQNIKAAYSYQRAVEQIIGREGETATFLSRCVVSFNLRVIGFAPRHLSRYASFVKMCAALLMGKV